MADWLSSIQGTSTGSLVALILALNSALFHAIFGAMQKSRYDPWLTRGAIDICYALLALPVALFFVPAPSAGLWLLLFGAMIIHVIYKVLMALAYERGAFTAVYPIVRGTGPLVTVAFAYLIFAEAFTPAQWSGVLLLSGAIFALAVTNIQRANIDRDLVRAATGIALLGGISTAAYTTYDAYGMRAAPNPFTFLAWFFVLDGIVMPLIALRRYRRLAAPLPLPPLMLRGLIGAVIAIISFGGIMIATTLDKVGEAAVLRETSVVFAAIIGWLFLKEKVGPRRFVIILTIALGAVIVEFGG